MKTVLIVDDEADLLDVYRQELTEAGYATQTAADGPSAVEAVQGGDIDCVIMDIRMPGESGLDALTQIRQIDRGLPVVLNSAYSVYRNDFQSWLADAYVVKSGDVSELVATVDGLLSGLEESPGRPTL